MRSYQFLVFAIFFSFLGSCQNLDSNKNSEIDMLSSDTEIQNFIQKNFKNLRNYKVQKIQDFKSVDFAFQSNKKLADELGVDESFYKADFDKNGLPDLLVIGDNFSCNNSSGSCSFTPIIIMNFGEKKYSVIDIPSNFHDKFTPKIVNVNGEDLLEIYRPENLEWKNEKPSKNPKKQVLTYKFGDFIEYSSNKNNYIPIKKIELSTNGCFGTCPIFDMEISQDKSAKFVAKHFNFKESEDAFGLEEDWSKEEGIFETKIKEKDFNNLIKLLEYVDFPQLENFYSVNWTDDQTVTLKITYGNNKVKKIEDYGAVGTYGLRKVYKTLFDFRKNQNWEKVKE